MTLQANKTKEYLEYWNANRDLFSNLHVELDEYSIYVSKGVFSPAPDLTRSTYYLVRQMIDVSGKSVLDVGTGTGIVAIVAAKRGAAVVSAVDIETNAVICANANVKSIGVGEVVSVYEGDIVPVETEVKYDVVLANLPIYYGNRAGELYDKFFRKIDNRIADNANLQITSSSFGAPLLLESKLKSWGYGFDRVEMQWHGVDWYIYSAKKTG